MLEGTRRIILIEPNPTGETDEYSQNVEGPVKGHGVWAIREDKPSAGEGLVSPDVVGGIWTTHFIIRSESVSSEVTPDWNVIDEKGVRYDIEGVFEKNSGPRARRLILVCERTAT